MAEMTNPGGGAAMSPTPACPNGRLYTVKPGDSMFTIARQSNIPLAALIAANPQIANPNMIFPGQQICVPGSSHPGPVCNGINYTVQAGDTMYHIARRYGLTLDALVAANPQIANPDMIMPGQVICLPGSSHPGPVCNGINYTVQAGDTMYHIARRYGLTLNALVAANPQIANPDMIMPGQVICVPIAMPPVPMPPVACPNGTLYTVRAGDTMFDIATRFGITLQALLAANPQIMDANRIFPGQSVCIPALTTCPVPPPPVAISPVVSPLMPEIPAMPIVPPMPMPVEPVMPTYPVVLPTPVCPFAPVGPAYPPAMPMPVEPVLPTYPVVLPTLVCPVAPVGPAYPPAMPFEPVMPVGPAMPYPSMMPQCPVPCPMMDPIMIKLWKKHHHHHHKKFRKCPCMMPVR